MMSRKKPSGEAECWAALRESDPDDVCRRSGAAYDPETGCYTCRCLGAELRLDPTAERIDGGFEIPFAEGEPLPMISVSLLHYLVSVTDVAPANNPVNPRVLPSGPMYSQGTHVLPLPQLAAAYADDPEAFLKRGRSLGGVPLDHGDAAVRLEPFPRTAMVVVLWTRDDEFPERASLLTDERVEEQIPADIVWAAAMFCVLAMMPS